MAAGFPFGARKTPSRTAAASPAVRFRCAPARIVRNFGLSRRGATSGSLFRGVSSSKPAAMALSSHWNALSSLPSFASTHARL